MLQSDLLDLALGVLFVFTLFSLLVTAAQELLAGLMKSRAKGLWDGIRSLLDDSDTLRDKVFAHPLLRSVAPPTSLALLSSRSRKGPSYIDPRTFATVLLDLLDRPDAVIGGVDTELRQLAADLAAGGGGGPAAVSSTLSALAAQLQAVPGAAPLGARLQTAAGSVDATVTTAAQAADVVRAVLAELPAAWQAAVAAQADSLHAGLGDTLKAVSASAAGDIHALRSAIENWYTDAMRGVAGWYKRWTQFLLFGIGLVLAALLNVDTVRIVTHLTSNPAAREAAARAALDYVAATRREEQEGTSTEAPESGVAPGGLEAARARYEEAERQLLAVKVPLGWDAAGEAYVRTKRGWAMLGWMITALAGSLGAPFWFDLLGKAANLRAAGPKPATGNPK